MLDLGSARHWARAIQREALLPGDTAVDATMGNGHDTLAFCELAGSNGHVYAFDVQEAAVCATRARLQAAGLLDRATLFCRGHETMEHCVPSGVSLVAFNLGWLPGSPDKAMTTKVETTCRALTQGFALLKKGGVMTVCAYPGHAEGERELDAVLAYAQALPPGRAQCRLTRYLNQGCVAPVLLVIQKMREDA